MLNRIFSNFGVNQWIQEFLDHDDDDAASRASTPTLSNPYFVSLTTGVPPDDHRAALHKKVMPTIPEAESESKSDSDYSLVDADSDL